MAILLSTVVVPLLSIFGWYGSHGRRFSDTDLEIVYWMARILWPTLILAVLIPYILWNIKLYKERKARKGK